MSNRRRDGTRASMREVANLAGVAMSSVSRVMSDHPDVSPEMRDRVMVAVERLGYQPDLLAQSLRRRSTRSVGFVVGDIANPLLAQIASGAEHALRASGYSMLLTNSENDPALDARHLGLLDQRRVDGFLLSLASEDDPATLAALATIEGPVVLIDRELPATVRASAVLSDHRVGMMAAVGHLLELGHREIGLILGQPLRFTRERSIGLEQAYVSLDLPPTYTIVEGRLDARHGREATRALLDAPRAPTALVVGGNQLLIGALEELRARSLRIGADISLVSCDAVPLTELHDPPIAVVRRDNVELGQQAARLLLDQLENDAGPSQLLLPTQFVPRPSCAPPLR
jgi:LacI family transcriptional regulator